MSNGLWTSNIEALIQRRMELLTAIKEHKCLALGLDPEHDYERHARHHVSFEFSHCPNPKCHVCFEIPDNTRSMQCILCKMSFCTSCLDEQH